MGSYHSVWKRIWEQLKENREEGFEAFYILTYPKVYGMIAGAVWDQDRAEQLLKEFYVKVFCELEKAPKEPEEEGEIYAWLEYLLHQNFGIQLPDEREEKPEECYLAEEKAATLFFEIEEKLGLGEHEEEGGSGRDGEDDRKKQIFRRVLTAAAAAAVLGLAIWGTWKVKGLIGRWGESMRVILASETEVPVPEFSGESEERQTEEEKEEGKTIQVGAWSILISEEGETLKEERLEQPVSHGAVQEVTAQNGEKWTLMLMREDAFPDAETGLKNSLVCRPEKGDSYGLIAAEAEDFCVVDSVIYYADEDGVKTESLISLEWTEQKELEYGFVMKTDGFYLLNAFGEPEPENYVQKGDRILRVDGGKIKYARQAEENWNGLTFYLAEADKDVGAELCASDGSQAWVFQKGKRWIDSFCMADGWIYYSAYEEMDENKLRYSRIYRAKPDGTDIQQVTELFRGNVTAMYYFPQEGVIYGEFKPDSYHEYYGQIVKISLNGEMATIDDQSARSSKKTAGNDMLELLDAENGKIFCYWHDCRVNGTQVEVLWTRPVILDAGER